MKTPTQHIVSKPENPDSEYLHLLQKVDFKPIFIMAEHRSGTTLLYQTLAATKCFNFISAYHIIKYNEILSNYLNNKESQSCEELQALLNSLGIEDRIIDNVKVTPNLPEEYGFVLNNFGYESHLNPENIHILTELCKKIQFVSDINRPLLLKNPWCFQHFMYVKSAFPQAKFIFIHRHPIHVINSKLKAIRSALSHKNEYTYLISKRYRTIFEHPLKLFLYRLLYSSSFNLGLRRVTQTSITEITYFLENIDSLSTTDYTSITYEELCSSPEITILQILQFLGLEAQEILDYKKLIQQRPLKLLPEVEQKYDAIMKQLKSYCAGFNYN